MKKLFKIVVCMAFAVLLTTVTAFAAEPSVSYHTSSANNIVIKGIITDAYGGELVSIKAEDSAGYAHLGIAQCEADGSYTYKFSYDGDASKLKVSVRQGSEDITSTVVSAVSESKLYDIELELLNTADRTFQLGADKNVTLRAAIDNIYGSEDNCTLIAAFYDNAGSLIRTQLHDYTMKYAADGKKQTVNFNVGTLPENVASVKGFIMNSLSRLTPLAPAPLRTVKQYGIDNLTNEEGELKVAFLGGSITAGTGALTNVPADIPSDEKNLAYNRYSTVLMREFFEKNYPNRKITQINAGIGGTASNSGLMRIKKDITDFEPDVVFLEYAINDALHGFGEYYEEVVRILLNLPKQPAIIALYSAADRPYDYDHTSGNGKWWSGSAKDIEEEICQHYGIGSVDFDGYIYSLYEAKKAAGETYDFSEWFTDHVHPNYYGHKAYGEYIAEQLNNNFDEYFKKINNETVRLNKVTGFDDPYIIQCDDERLKYEGDWGFGTENIPPDDKPNKYARAPKDGGTITFEFKGESIGMTGTVVGGEQAGATYSIDGGKYTGEITAQKDGDTPETYVPEANFFRLTGLSDTTHTITITANGSEKESARLRFNYIIVNGEEKNK